jgi:hypothetical protein
MDGVKLILRVHVGVPLLSNDSLFTELCECILIMISVGVYEIFYSNGIAVMDQNMDTLQNGELYYNPSFTFPLNLVPM